MSEKHKRYLVAFTAFVYAIVCIYLLITGVAFQAADLGSYGIELRNKVFLILSPILFAYLGFHHLTKQQGVAQFSILTYVFLGFGIISFLLMISEKDGGIFINIALIISGLIHLLLCYWCYQNKDEVDEVISKSTKLDLDQIFVLIKEMKTDNFSNAISDKYGKTTTEAAMQVIKEEQLHIISNIIHVGAKLEIELGNHKQVLELIMDKLSDAYVELDSDSKYVFVPLFLNKEDENTSYYFFDSEVQKWAQNSYEVLLKKDKLTFEDMKEEYYACTPLAKEYPYMFGEIQLLNYEDLLIKLEKI